jgi:4-hydroxy-tetrahydrodipicolinate reductase
MIAKKKQKRVGLIGFGKTGKSVASVLLQNKKFDLEWVLRKSELLDHRSVPEFLGIKTNDPGLMYSLVTITIEELLDKHPVDLIIDFASATAIYDYGKLASKRGIKIISAISHYSKETIEYLKELATETTVFWSPNMTIGVNYLLFAGKFLKKIAPWVDIEIIEEHFKEKAGVSGTAIKLAESLDISRSEINSIRAGGIVGKHEIIFGFPFQTVRLIHESISREAFGNGAIFIAESIADKENGFYNFEDVLTEYIATID